MTEGIDIGYSGFLLEKLLLQPLPYLVVSVSSKAADALGGIDILTLRFLSRC